MHVEFGFSERSKQCNLSATRSLKLQERSMSGVEIHPQIPLVVIALRHVYDVYVGPVETKGGPYKSRFQ